MKQGSKEWYNSMTVKLEAVTHDLMMLNPIKRRVHESILDMIKQLETAFKLPPRSQEEIRQEIIDNWIQKINDHPDLKLIDADREKGIINYYYHYNPEVRFFRSEGLVVRNPDRTIINPAT